MPLLDHSMRALLIILFLTLNCCSITQKNQADQGQLSSVSDGLKQCVALRGNGNWISAHFGSLARIIEDYGEIDGLAGGSSATITTFLYESMMSNSVLDECAPEDADCFDEKISEQKQRELRLSLLLKSAYGFLSQVKKISLEHAEQTAWHFQNFDLIHEDLSTALGEDSGEFLKNIKEIERKFRLKGIINPEWIKFVTDETLPWSFRHKEARDSISTLGGFRIESNEAFFRPGIIDFRVFANTVGRIADFYAGRFSSPQVKENLDRWLDRCSTKTQNMSWQTINEHSSPRLRDCSRDFFVIIDKYLDTYDAQIKIDTNTTPRIFDQVGSYVPAMLGTSVLSGEAVASFKYYREKYRRRKNFAANESLEDFAPNYAQLGFGYWGPSVAFLEEVSQNLNTLFADDEKSRKFVNLGRADWQTVLLFSPAEPGLSPIKELTNKNQGSEYKTNYLSAGGWADLHPVQVTRAMGCEKIIYVTREAGEADLALDAAARLGGKKHLDELYFVEGQGSERFVEIPNSRSSFQTALENANGIWCTDWNHFSGDKVLEMAEEAYKARFFSNDPHYLKLNRPNALDLSTSAYYVPSCQPVESLSEEGGG